MIGLTKKQLDGLGLREIGRDKKGRLIAVAAELIEVDPVGEAINLLEGMTDEQLAQWFKDIRSPKRFPKT